MLRRIWTCLGKTWALPFIFVGGGLITLLGMPVMSFFAGARDEQALLLMRGSFRFYLWLLQALHIIRIEISGKELLTSPGGKVIIANHPSLLDVVILMSCIPRPQCIVKNELWSHRFLGGLMRKAGFIRNDLDAEALIEACKTSIKDGRGLIIFPEGTRTVPGHLPHFQRGFATIAFSAESQIVPVFIECNPPFLYKGEAWWQAPRSIPVFRISVGKPLDAPDYFSYGSRSLAARKLSVSLENLYAERLDNHSRA
jgi:1-acyl-sn-glycerol-3-phosphate acyltransferase